MPNMVSASSKSSISMTESYPFASTIAPSGTSMSAIMFSEINASVKKLFILAIFLMSATVNVMLLTSNCVNSVVSSLFAKTSNASIMP